MICNLEDKNMMMQYAPALYQKLVEIDKTIQAKGFEILIRNTDHWYDSFEWKVVQSPNSVHDDKDKSTDEYELYNIIKTNVYSTCCQCGSNFHVSQEPYNPTYSSYMFHNKCIVCQARGEKLGYQRILKLAEANTIAKKEKQSINLPKIKIRLVNEQGHIFYDYLQNLYVDSNSFILSNQYNTHEKVKYAGLSLGVRDENGERLYEGDLVVAKCAKNGQLFLGMAYLLDNDFQKKITDIPNDIVLSHGWNQFPSPLTLAESFKIVGNVITNHEEELHINQLKQEFSGGLEYLYQSHDFSDVFEHIIK